MHRLPETDRPTDRDATVGGIDRIYNRETIAAIESRFSLLSREIAAFESWRDDFRRNGIKAYKRNQAQPRSETATVVFTYAAR